MLRFMYIK